MSEDILTQTAAERFGIMYLFPYQRLVITNILRRSGYFVTTVSCH
jgi:preprotein translocase subunit SecB